MQWLTSLLETDFLVFLVVYVIVSRRKDNSSRLTPTPLPSLMVVPALLTSTHTCVMAIKAKTKSLVTRRLVTGNIAPLAEFVKINIKTLL